VPLRPSCAPRENERDQEGGRENDEARHVPSRNRDALGRGMKAIGARLARAVNRVMGRSGSVLADRYHVRLLPRARTWLLTIGWRRRGSIDPGDVPG
jgi:hypothetical protein